MKRSLTAPLIISALLLATSVHAETSKGITTDPWKFRAGFGLDLGVPSGAALGLVVHPKTDMAEVSIAGTYNGFGPGGRVGLKLDPLGIFTYWPIGVVIDIQGGFATKGTLLGHSQDFPALDYQYANLYGGLRLGNPDGFHWFFEAGPTYIHATASNLSSVINNSSSTVTVGPATMTGWFVPTFSMGFSVVWP